MLPSLLLELLTAVLVLDKFWNTVSKQATDASLQISLHNLGSYSQTYQGRTLILIAGKFM
jgi:hypothetical protein